MSLKDCLEYHPVAGDPTAAGIETGGVALARNETFDIVALFNPAYQMHFPILTV